MPRHSVHVKMLPQTDEAPAYRNHGEEIAALRDGTHPALSIDCPGCGRKIPATHSAELDFTHESGWCTMCGGSAQRVAV